MIQLKGNSIERRYNQKAIQSKSDIIENNTSKGNTNRKAIAQTAVQDNTKNASVAGEALGTSSAIILQQEQQ